MADGQRIKQLRQARGLSIAGLAKAANITRPTVYAAEASESLGLETSLKLAAALGVPLSEISADAAALVEAAS